MYGVKGSSVERVPDPGKGRGLSNYRIIGAKGRVLHNLVFRTGLLIQHLVGCMKKTNGLGSLSVFRSRQDCFSKGVSSGRDLRMAAPILNRVLVCRGCRQDW